MSATRSTRWSEIRRPMTPERRAQIDAIKGQQDETGRVIWLDRFVGVAAITSSVLAVLAIVWTAVALGLLPSPPGY